MLKSPDKSVSQSVHDEFKCCVCLEIRTPFRYLLTACSNEHTLCLDCIMNILSVSSRPQESMALQCPVCRQKSEVFRPLSKKFYRIFHQTAGCLSTRSIENPTVDAFDNLCRIGIFQRTALDILFYLSLSTENKDRYSKYAAIIDQITTEKARIDAAWKSYIASKDRVTALRKRLQQITAALSNVNPTSTSIN